MDHHQEVEGGSNGKSTGGYLCRQSSTRWSPTSEQIRILKDLYYNNGVRSPTADQIQRISAKLRQYGKIEGKNVFYWFQNHKARERQKKRFTAPTHHFSSYPPPLKFPSPPNFPSSSSPALLTVGNYGYGSMAMEKSFRECTITPSSSTNVGGGGGGGNHHNFTWIGVDPYSTSPYPFLEDQNRIYTTALNQHNAIAAADQTLETEDDEAGEEDEEERETLPLFPMHGDLKQDINYHHNDYIDNSNYSSAGWHRRPEDSIAAASKASLELTLNSYAARFPATS